MSQTFKKYLQEKKVTKLEVEKIKKPDDLLDVALSSAGVALEDFMRQVSLFSRYGGHPNLRKITALYKGWRTSKKPGIYDSTNAERKSQNTSNYYTRFFDTNPANAAWPKRSKSFICSTNFDRAFSYGGDSYDKFTLLLPFDGVKIASVGLPDMWDVRNLNGFPIENINYLLKTALHVDPQLTFIEFIDELSKSISNKDTRDKINRLGYDEDDDPESIIKDFKDAYTYDNTNFYL
jgi:hypothetical protein